MKVTLKTNVCVVDREDTDPKFYSESTLLHHVKLALLKQGFDVIKKLAWKDGNLVGDDLHWIRVRNPKDPNWFAVYDGQYCVRKSTDDFNKGQLLLDVSR